MQYNQKDIRAAIASGFSHLMTATDSPSLRAILHAVASMRTGGTTAIFCATLYGELGGTDKETAFRIARFTEYNIAGTMVLDDIVEQHDIRMNQPSIHARYGTGRAIIAGTFLLHKSYAEIAPYRTTHLHALDTVYAGWTDKDTVFGKDSDDCFSALRNLGSIYGAFGSITAAIAGMQSERIDALATALTTMGIAKEIVDELHDITGNFRRTTAAEYRSGEDILITTIAKEYGIIVDSSDPWRSVRNTIAHHVVVAKAQEALRTSSQQLTTLFNKKPPSSITSLHGSIEAALQQYIPE